MQFMEGKGNYKTDLPVLSLTGEHHRIFILRDLSIVLVLSLLDVLLSLEALILRESTVVALLWDY